MWMEERNGRFRYSERYTDPRSGLARKVSVTLDKKSDKKAYALLQQKIQAATVSLGDYTLKQVTDLYLADQKKTVSTATFKRNKSALIAINRILGGYNKIDKITAGYIRERLLASGKPARTCNGYIKRLVGFIRWAYQNDLIISTACVDKLSRFKDTPQRERIQDKFLNGSELALLLEEMEEGYSLITEFLALSGLRIGELIALEDKDVTDVIHVSKSYSVTAKEITPGKTFCSRRDIHVQPELADCIRRLRHFMKLRKFATGAPNSPYFCIDRKGHRLQYAAYCKYFKQHTKAVVGRELTPHSLRHTHASLLMEAGYPIESISRRLGHENSDITKEIYLHVTDGIRKRDAELIDSISILPPNCPQSSSKSS